MTEARLCGICIAAGRIYCPPEHSMKAVDTIEREAAVQACLNERVDADATGHLSDVGYNNAINDCVIAIRSLPATQPAVATCLMADCEDAQAHFCVTHVLEVHCPTVQPALASEGVVQDTAQEIIALLVARYGSLPDGLYDEIQQILRNVSPPAEQMKDSCWHCGVVLVSIKPRCPDCPDECDEENCSEMGCAPDGSGELQSVEVK